MLLASSLGVATEAKEGATSPSVNQWGQTSQLTGIFLSSLDCERSIALCVHRCLTVQVCVCTYIRRGHRPTLAGISQDATHFAFETVPHWAGTHRVDWAGRQVSPGTYSSTSLVPGLQIGFSPV